MKKQTIYQTLFVVVMAIGSIFMISSCDSKGTGNATTTTAGTPTSSTSNAGKLSIAYVNMDSLYTRYSYYLSAQKALDLKNQQASNTLEKKTRALQKEFYSFQEKAQKGELTANQIAQKEQSLGKKQEALAKEEQKYRQEIGTETAEVMDTLVARLNRASQAIADKHGYEYVLKHAVGSMIIIAPSSSDVTEEVLTILNAEASTK